MKSKRVTLWRGHRRWYQSRYAAFYSIAKALVLTRYPVWLDDTQYDDEQREAFAVEHGVENWRARRDRAVELFWDESGCHFRQDRWQRFVRRVARFLSFADRKATS